MRTRIFMAVATSAVLCGAPGAVRAQFSSPVYLNDSPRTVDGLVRAAELAGAGNLFEAAGILQELLTNDSDRMVARWGDADLFVNVRTRVHEVLLSNPELLTSYRTRTHSYAEKLLEQGAYSEAERAYFLTAPGFDATLRIAQQQLERAQFHGALYTIAQLDGHPDRQGARSERAAALGGLIVSYLEDHQREPRGAMERVLGWLNNPVLGAERPPALTSKGLVDSWDPIMPDGLLPRPLWQEYFGEERTGRHALASEDDPIPASAQSLDIWPAVQGEDVFVNDGQTVSAWNRITLSQHWSVVLPDVQSGAKEVGSGTNEANTVVAADGWVLALSAERSGRSQNKQKRALHAIDAASGRVVWSRTVGEFAVDAIAQADFVGPVVIDQGVVIVGALKDIAERRLDSAHMLGIDLRSGRLLWSRTIASSGKLPWGSSESQYGITTVRDGIAYRTDWVGAVSSFEVTTGRVRWVRRVPRELTRTGRELLSWAGRSVVVHEGVVITLSPDGRQIIVLDSETGESVLSRPSSLLNAPEYLIGVGGVVLGIGENSVLGIEIADLLGGGATHEWSVVQLEEPGIRGRVMVAGDELVVPTHDGFLLASLERGARDDARRIELDRPGNILPVGSQLVVVDDRQVHTYLVWASAERQLLERIGSDPDDPRPAVTYTELAYRAGRVGTIVPAADMALSAIDRDPLDPGNEHVRSRLFRALLKMVSPDSKGAHHVALDDSMREQIIDRLGLSASSAMEQVAYLMTAADFYTATDQGGRAVDAYQRVLLSEELAKSAYTQREQSVLAEEAASDRLRTTVRSFGKEVYQAYEDEARWQLDALRGSRDAAAYENIARRYPVSGAASYAVLEAASVFERQGRPNRAVRVLQRGLDSLESGWHNDAGVRNELHGRMIRQLERSGRIREASDRLGSLLSADPGLLLSEHGESIDPGRLRASLLEHVRAMYDRPAIGTTLTETSEKIGWVIHHPEDPTGRMPTDSVFMMSTSGELALWRVRENGLLRTAWGGVSDEIVLRVDGEFAYTMRLSPKRPSTSHVVVKRSMVDGHEVWASRDIGSRVRPAGGGPAGEKDERVIQQKQNAMEKQLYVFDARTLAVVGTQGRAIGIDLLSGRELWSRPRVLQHVADIAMGGGVLAIGGLDAVVENDSIRGSVLTLDSRTGDRITLQQTQAIVVWVEAGSSGSVLCGVIGGLVSLDPFREQTIWRHDFEDGVNAEPVINLPGRIMVKDQHNRLWQVFPDETSAPMIQVETKGRVTGSRGMIAAADFGTHLMVSTTQGVVLVDREGEVVGVDIRDSSGEILPALAGQDNIVTIDMTPELEPDRAGRPLNPSAIYPVRVYSAASCRLESTTLVQLGRLQGFMDYALTDGKILITVGQITTVIDAPASR